MRGKKLVAILIVLFFWAGNAWAKGDKEPSQHPLTADEIVAKMKFQLGLTDQQVQEVKPIIVDHLAKEKELKLEEKKQLSKVLTGQQLYTWDFINTEKPKNTKKQSIF